MSFSPQTAQFFYCKYVFSSEGRNKKYIYTFKTDNFSEIKLDV